MEFFGFQANVSHLGASQDGGSPKSSKSSEHLSNYVLLVTWESPIERNPQMDPQMGICHYLILFDPRNWGFNEGKCDFGNHGFLLTTDPNLFSTRLLKPNEVVAFRLVCGVTRSSSSSTSSQSPNLDPTLQMKPIP